MGKCGFRIDQLIQRSKLIPFSHGLNDCSGINLIQQGFRFEIVVEAVKKFLENIVGNPGALLVKCGKRLCPGIEMKIFEQFMTDGNRVL